MRQIKCAFDQTIPFERDIFQAPMMNAFAGGILIVWCGLWLPPVNAQPLPSFTATCEGLRAKSAALGTGEEKLVTINVVGELTIVEHDGTVAYMGMCDAPDPKVLCVT